MEPSGLVSWPAALQIVYNLAGRPAAKSEIPNWYGEALAWAQDNGLLDGLTFDAEQPIGRAEMVTLLYRFAQKKNQRLTVEASLDDFVDADAVPAYAQEAARWAVGCGILKGDDSQRLNPESAAYPGADCRASPAVHRKIKYPRAARRARRQAARPSIFVLRYFRGIRRGGRPCPPLGCI